MPSTTLSASYNLPLLITITAGIGGGGSTFAALAGTIPVNSTNGFPSTGILTTEAFDNSFDGTIPVFIINYTGITTTSFTGCTLISGSATNYIVNSSPISYIGGGGSGSINVVSTSGFPTIGELRVNGNVYLNYTGVSGNTFTGITGGNGAISNGQIVTYLAGGAATTTLLTGAESFGELNLPQANSWGFYDMNATLAAADPNFYDNTNYDPINAVNYKMRGYYTTGQVYETWIVQNAPSYTPPSGHTLVNIIVEDIF
jgi:hypothetical protein